MSEETLKQLARLEALSAALDEQQDRTALALDASGAGIWDWDIESGSLYFGDGMLQLLQLRTFGNTFESFIALVHPDDRERVRTAVNHALIARTTYDCVYRLAGHPLLVIRSRGKAYYKQGKPARMVGVCVEDIRPMHCRSCSAYVLFTPEQIAEARSGSSTYQELSEFQDPNQ
jgi:PAS domain-containing protein